MRRAILIGTTVLAATFGFAWVASARVSAMQTANGQE